MDNNKPEADRTTADISAEREPKGSFFSAASANDKASEGKTKGGLPVAEPFQALSALAGADRAGVFGQLVKEDSDIAGLVAYSIYKQNKLDWLNAFEAEKGRAPNPDELSSYIIGEGTPRRIAIYRHLAEATLAGNGPNISGAAGQGVAGFRRPGGFGGNTKMTPSLIATYALIVGLFLIAFLLAAHYTMTSR